MDGKCLSQDWQSEFDLVIAFLGKWVKIISGVHASKQSLPSCPGVEVDEPVIVDLPCPQDSEEDPRTNKY